MRIPNHAEGFSGQWGYPQWVEATDLSESFWSDVEDEDASSNADPLLILLDAEEANA